MGVVFLVVVPTEKYEKSLKAGITLLVHKITIMIRVQDLSAFVCPFISRVIGITNADMITAAKNYNFPAARKNDLNVTSPADNPNAILKMEVELRDKNQAAKKRVKNKAKQFTAMDMNVGAASGVDLPMEKVGK